MALFSSLAFLSLPSSRFVADRGNHNEIRYNRDPIEVDRNLDVFGIWNFRGIKKRIGEYDFSGGSLSLILSREDLMVIL